jgi:hypothetical protein
MWKQKHWKICIAAESDIAFALHVTGLQGTLGSFMRSCSLLTTLSLGTQIHSLDNSGTKAHR